MNKIIDMATKRPKTVLILILLLSIPFGYAYLHKSFFNNVSLYFDKDDPSIIAYEKFQEAYGHEEIAVIVVQAPEIFTNRVLGIIREISQMAKSSQGVQRVFSITEATTAVGRADTLAFEPIVPPGPLDAEQLQDVRKYVLQKEFAIETLMSKSGQAAAIILELTHIPSAEKKGEVLSRITARAEKIAGKDVTLYFSGAPFVEYEINSLTQRDDKIFAPLIVVLIFLMTATLLRKASQALLCLANIFFIIVWATGLFILTGHRFTMVTVVMPPIILAIAVADAVHILSHFNAIYAANGQDLRQTISKAASNLWLPCLFTSLTTGIGFLSFVTATIGPVRTLGIFTFIGVMLAFVMTIVVLPALVAAFGIQPARTTSNHPAAHTPGASRPGNSFVGTIGQIAVGHYKVIGICMILIMIAGLIGTFQLRFETNFASHLSEDNRIKQGLRFIEDNLFGTVPVALLIRANSADNDFTHAESLKLVDTLQAELKKEFAASYSAYFSISDYFKEIHRAFNQGDDAFFVVPDRRSDILDYYELGEAEALQRVVSPDRMEARIAFNAYMDASVEKAKYLQQYLADTLPSRLGDRFSYQLTGLSILYVEMEQNLRRCQIRSFSVAFVIIFFMMLLVCRNFKLTLISMLPNLFPILCTYGLMGFLNIPIDVSTIMIASVTIGIAVDDTIHFLVWYRRNELAGMETKEALLKTFTDTGKPILITSIILFVSFFTFMSGSILAIRAFGILTGLSMLFALVGDFFLFPALILFFKPKISVAPKI